jgi:3,4-dihydroxy 2-butanone 4-phosphate synthase/GTP cyclohydrolase II
VYTQLVSHLDTPAQGFDSIEAALGDLAQGKFVVVLDDEDRENEGDLIINADKMTTESMAFMVEYTSGVICISMDGSDMNRLKLPLMVPPSDNNESMSTAFTITIDLKEGCTTGISAADRTSTIRRMADPSSHPDEFRRPGHIFPLRYRQGGVITRPGHTEAALDLARLSGSYPAGVLCEIVNKADGSMSRTPQLMAFAKEHNLRIITIADLVRYRLHHDQLLQHVAAVPLDTRAGLFTAHCFRSLIDGSEHAALVAGSVSGAAEVPVSMQQQNLLVDVFGSTHCGEQSFLDRSMQTVSAAGQGIVLYIKPHSSATTNPSLVAQLESHLQEQQSCSTSSPSSSSSGSSEETSSSSRAFADLRDYATAAHMLRHLGVASTHLLGHSQADADQLAAFGVVSSSVAAAAAGGASGSSWEANALRLQTLGNGSSSMKPAGVS